MPSISIHRALKTKKTLEDRINSALSSLTIMQVVTKGQEKIVSETVEEFKKRNASIYQQINDLVNEKNKLERAISESNAKTFVTVSGETLTVSAAILQRNHIEMLKMVRHRLATSRLQAVGALEQKQKDYESKLERHLSSISSSQQKLDAVTITKLTEAFEGINSPVIANCINVDSEIKKLDDQISNFEEDIDIVLSESNAKTMIEI